MREHLQAEMGENELYVREEGCRWQKILKMVSLEEVQQELINRARKKDPLLIKKLSMLYKLLNYRRNPWTTFTIN